jgi:glycosyltransferase involved in cell wall biosynthesis
MRSWSIVKDSLVFIPAWNEEDSLPSVLAELREELPDADVLVVDDGSTDGTVALARAAGAEVVSFAANRGLREAVAAGWAWAHERGYWFCGRVDADGQHPVPELRRLLERVRAGECDVALGSRFVSGDGYPAYRYLPSPARRFGTAVLRRALRVRTGRAIGDSTSGMMAANAAAIELLAQPYLTGAPEVEALIRLGEAGLRIDEVPVNMRERSAGESKLQGAKAVKLVLTVAGALVLGRRTLRRWQRG